MPVKIAMCFITNTDKPNTRPLVNYVSSPQPAVQPAIQTAIQQVSSQSRNTSRFNMNSVFAAKGKRGG